MPNTHNIFAYLRTRGPTSFGIRAGLPVGNPYYWSMLSLAVVKTILKLKGFAKTLDMILFTPHLDTLMLHLTLFDLKGFTSYLNFKPLGNTGWVVFLVLCTQLRDSEFPMYLCLSGALLVGIASDMSRIQSFCLRNVLGIYQVCIPLLWSVTWLVVYTCCMLSVLPNVEDIVYR